MYIPRSIEDFLLKASSQFPVLLVTGARQVGKTTLLENLSQEGRSYVTLDDPLVRELATRDPSLFLQRYQPPILIDEIQYAPDLLPLIKIEVDQHKEPGAFWLTGSQPFHLMKGVSESLAGRVGVVQLSGLSYRESLQKVGEGPFLPTSDFLAKRESSSPELSLQEVYFRIWRGSFPAMVANEDRDRNLFFQSYLETYLQRDVRDLTKVGDEMAFLRFIRASAARTGQLLNVSELARDADVSPNTGKEWLSILKGSGLIYLLEPWHTNVTKRLVKAPKLYFMDTGLCSWLTEWSSPETLEAGAMSGAILETWVVGEIMKSWGNSGLRPPIYFYRDRDQREVDLLIHQDNTFYPLEMKKSASPSKRDIKHFSALSSLGKRIGPGGVICLAKNGIPLKEDISVIPVGWL